MSSVIWWKRKAKKDELDKPEKPSERSKNQNESPENSNKLNWAICLGIAAVMIGFIGLIFLVSRRKEK